MRSFQQIGRLRAAPTRSSGKIVDVWTFHAASPGVSGGMTAIKVEVTLMQGDDGLYFKASPEGFRESFTNANIELLRVEVEARLAELTAIALGVVWEDWLRVELQADDDERAGVISSKAGLVLTVSTIKRGVLAATGEAYTVNNGYAIRFPESSMATGELPTGWAFRGDKEVAYVPDTPENRAALADARQRLRTLRMRLSAVFRQDVVQSTLADLGGQLNLLAPPAASGPSDASSSEAR